MAIRVTILMDEDVNKKLRLKQAKLLQKSSKTVSFSSVLNQTLRTCLRK